MPSKNDKNTSASTLSNDYWEETAKGIANVLAHLRGTWYDRDLKGAYRHEQQQLEKYVTPFKYGLGAALFLFVNFRITGHPRFQFWRKDFVANWRGRQPSPQEPLRSSAAMRQKIKPTPTPPQHQPSLGYLEAKRDREIKEALNSMRLITDVLVSVSVGTSGVLFLLQAHQNSMRKDFEQAPLVPGRSVVAEQICAPFLELPAPSFSDNEDDVNMATFSKFRENCQKRRDLERLIRQQKGLADDAQLTIPYPGVEGYERRH